jgi:hypothetical protein
MNYASLFSALAVSYGLADLPNIDMQTLLWSAALVLQMRPVAS